MKAEDIFNALGYIDDDLLEAALDEQPKKRNVFPEMKRAVAAAVIVVLVCSVILFISFISGKKEGQRKPSHDDILSLITPTPETAETEVPHFYVDENNAKVYMKINPYVCFTVNEKGDIVNIIALNDEGNTLVSDYSFTGKTMKTAVTELILEAKDLGFLSTEGQVTFSIDAADTDIANNIDKVLDTVRKDNEVNFDINVRRLLSLKNVKTSCADHFGISPDIIHFKELECHADHQVARYLAEFKLNNKIYSCKINAVSGEVYDIEIYDPDTETATPTPVVTVAPTATPKPTAAPVTAKPTAVATKAPTATKAPVATKAPAATKVPAATKAPPATKAPVATTAPSDMITEEEALKIALADAKVTDYDFEKIELRGHTCDKHTAMYKVEFISGAIEYKYEINSITGEIKKAEMKDNSAKPAGPAAKK